MTVSDGYARNFLFPRGLAAEADARAMNELKNKEEAARFHEEQEKKAAKETAEAVNGKVLKLTAKAGAGRPPVRLRHRQGSGGGAGGAVRRQAG